MTMSTHELSKMCVITHVRSETVVRKPPPPPPLPTQGLSSAQSSIMSESIIM